MIIRSFVFFFLFLLELFASICAYAAPSFDLDIADDKHHVTADRTLYHSKEKVYEAFGHVVISSKGRRLSSDYAWIDTTKKELKARGNVIFVNTSSVIQASEIHYNLETQLGSIFYGSVSNDFYTLKGQLIRRVSEDHFLTTEGEYTTCKDCAESWKLAAKDVDLTMDGYAFMNSVYVKVKDTPTLYVPYLVMPVKTRRQTGLLFPKMGGGSVTGFAFVQPLFIAIDKHQDATVSLGNFSAKGKRMELEYRYKSYDGFEGSFNFYRTNDKSSQRPRDVRTAFRTDNNWPLTDFAKIKWRVREVSDQKYPSEFSTLGDMPGENQPAIESNFVFYSPGANYSIGAEIKRYRNLLYDKSIGFDTGTVQAMPSVFFGIREREAGPLTYNVTSRFDNYHRANGSFQDDNNNHFLDTNGLAPENIRETQRLLVTPELALPFRVSDIVSVSPSIQYNEIHYNFPDLPAANSDISSTYRRYIRWKIDSSSVFERVYDYNGEKINKVKHQLIPFVTYSNIPWRDQDEAHPFSKQLKNDGGLFDQFDIVPLKNSTNFLRVPEGNAIRYGFTSHLIRRTRSSDEVVRSYPFDLLPRKEKKYPEPKNLKQENLIEENRLWDKFGPRYASYEQVWDLSVSQAYDFKEAHDEPTDKKRAFSFLQVISRLSMDHFTNTIEYQYFPRVVTQPTADNPNPPVYSNQSLLSTSTTWEIQKLKNSRGTLFFERSISLGFTNNGYPTPGRSITGNFVWSINDYINFAYDRQNDLITHKKLLENFRTMFSSPSECWQIGFHYNQKNSNGKTINFGIDFGVNLFGGGYVGVNQMSQVGSSSNSPLSFMR